MDHKHITIEPVKNFDSLASLEKSHLFYSVKWLKLLDLCYGYPLYIVKDNQSSQFLLMSKVQKFGSTKFIGLPFSDYTIPSVKDKKTYIELILSVQQWISKASFQLKFKLPENISKNDLSIPFQKTAICHIVKTEHKEKIENNMHSSFLRAVKKATKNNLKINITTESEAVERFFTIYHELRINKFGKLPQPMSFFTNLRETFFQDDSGFIIEVTKEQKTIASSIVLKHKDRLYYKFGCSAKEWLDLRPNNLLFYHLFHYANDHNFKAVDLGLSGTGDSYKGLRRFKGYMGGISEPIFTHLFQPGDYDSEIDEKIDDFTSSLTNQIVESDPSPSQTDKFSEILYPYFA